MANEGDNTPTLNTTTGVPEVTPEALVTAVANAKAAKVVALAAATVAPTITVHAPPSDLDDSDSYSSRTSWGEAGEIQRHKFQEVAGEDVLSNHLGVG